MNYLVYLKTKDDKRFNALSSLQNFTYAPSLVFASLIHESDLDELKKWCDGLKDLCIETGVKIEIRPYGKKSIYSVG